MSSTQPPTSQQQQQQDTQDEIAHSTTYNLGDIHVRLDFPSTKVDLILGTNNHMLQDIGNETNTTIGRALPSTTVLDDIHEDRVPISVRGRLPGVFEASQQIEKLVPEFVVPVVASFEVQNKRDIAGIIGARGSTVSRLEQSTNCHISTPPKNDPSKTITIQGLSTKLVFSCLNMLSQELTRAMHAQPLAQRVVNHGVPNHPMYAYPVSLGHMPYMPHPNAQGPASGPPPHMSPHHQPYAPPVPIPYVSMPYPAHHPNESQPLMHPYQVMCGDGKHMVPTMAFHSPSHSPLSPLSPMHSPLHSPHSPLSPMSVRPMMSPYPIVLPPQMLPELHPYAQSHHHHHHHHHPMFSYPMQQQQQQQQQQQHHHVMGSPDTMSPPLNGTHGGNHVMNGDGPGSPPDVNGLLTFEIEFPPEKAGLIFGRGGRTLNTVKRETNARVVVDADQGRIHIASTSARAAHKAKTMIQNILASSESQRLIYFGNLSTLEQKTMCFRPFDDPSLIRPREGRVFILAPAHGSASFQLDMVYNSEGLQNTRARERYGGGSAESSRTASPVASSMRSSLDGGAEGQQLFVEADAGAIRSRLFESLDRLKPAVGQVEILCRFGKMVFSRVPDEIVGVPLTIEALHQVIRARQILYTFEGGAGIPDAALHTVLSRLRGNAVKDQHKSVYYLSVLPDSQNIGLARRKRLDVMLEREVPVQNGQGDVKDGESEVEMSLKFCGVREPYMKPFKADLINIGEHVFDMRIAVRASALPIQGDGAQAIEQFASTVKVAGHLELEYPADSKFRVTGCALKAVENMTIENRGLSVEVIEHEGQASPRRFEFTATTINMESILGETGAGVVSTSSPDWNPLDVVNEFDGLYNEMQRLSVELTEETKRCV